MAAYVIFIRDKMKDPEELVAYREKAGKVNNEHVKLIAYDGEHEAWEGPDPEGVVILEFPDIDKARAWYNQPAYQEANVHRMKSAEYRTILIDGAK